MDMNLHEWMDQREDLLLSPVATRSSASRGREHPMEPCPMRSEFQRDRDRIIHCQSFRRLMYKTQVFLAPAGDHYRTRLTHTLEVTQIARTMARALRLNEDLTEAAALGHDLGHTPFGHAGEDALRICYDPDFAHYCQSLRVVEKLEKNGQGLNLCFEVRDAIVNHTGDSVAATPEGQLIKLADRIAYINHDIDDAIRAGILAHSDLPAEVTSVLGETHGERINTMVMSVVEASENSTAVSMTPSVQAATDALRAFLFERVYRNPVAKGQETKAKDMLARMYEYYIKNPQALPEDFQPQMSFDGLERTVCDYIAGMTDKYAVDKFTEIAIPLGWHVRG